MVTAVDTCNRMLRNPLRNRHAAPIPTDVELLANMRRGECNDWSAFNRAEFLIWFALRERPASFHTTGQALAREAETERAKGAARGWLSVSRKLRLRYGQRSRLPG